MKKALIVSIVCGALFGSIIGTGVANAAGLTTTQVSAIVALLQAFGVDQQTITIVQAEMSPATTTVEVQTNAVTTTVDQTSTTIQGVVQAFLPPPPSSSCSMTIGYDADGTPRMFWQEQYGDKLNVDLGSYGVQTYFDQTRSLNHIASSSGSMGYVMGKTNTIQMQGILSPMTGYATTTCAATIVPKS